MYGILTRILYEMEENRDTMLVTVVSEDGTGSRGTGARMLLGAAGIVTGTIGGGRRELEAVARGQELLAARRSGEAHFAVTVRPEDLGVPCGGEALVHFQYIPAGDADWKRLCGSVIDSINARQHGFLGLHLDGSCAELLSVRDAVDREACLPEGEYTLRDGVFWMPLPVGERAVIFGAGHCTMALAPLLHSVGFRVTVFDDRPEFASAERYPRAEQVICGDFKRISDFITLNAEDYVVVMTSGHRHDFEVQEQVLRGPLAYIGVIGSASKTAAIRKKLRECGISPEAVEQVHMPIGLPIKSVTPEEIAVSIAGEMILCRAQRRARAGVEQAHIHPMREES